MPLAVQAPAVRMTVRQLNPTKVVNNSSLVIEFSHLFFNELQTMFNPTVSTGSASHNVQQAIWDITETILHNMFATGELKVPMFNDNNNPNLFSFSPTYKASDTFPTTGFLNR
jgi:hypothetical protein